MENIFSDLRQALLQNRKVDGNLLVRSRGLLNFFDRETVFSVNEELSDLSDDVIKYLAVPFLHGLLILRQPTLSNEERLQILELAHGIFNSFINLVQSYGFEVPKLEPKERVDKIKLSALKGEVEYSINALGEAKKDIENYRQISVDFVQYCILRTFNEQLHIQRETELLKLDGNTEQEFPLAGNAQTAQSIKKIRPFVLGSRQDLSKQVFGPDHTLPTLSIEEFYEKTYGNGIDKPLSNIKSYVDTDSEEDIYKQRRKDEYNDENPRGSGNKFNRS